MNVTNDLTKQERVVLALVAQGWRTAKIAEQLFVSPRTVETHIAHIFEKLRVSTRTEAAIFALRADLIADVEIRTNTEDNRDDNSYAYGNELRESMRTQMKEKLA